MTRNSLLGTISLAVAGAAIGSGAIVSANAMADGDPPAPLAGSVQVISVTDDEDPISCTFDDLELPAMIDSAVPDGAVLGAVVAVSSADGSVIDDGTVVGDVSTSAQGVIVASAEAIPVDGPMPDDAQGVLTGVGLIEGLPGDLPDLEVIDAADARPGTADECAAIRADMP